jgi:hypothetical protein
MKICNACGRSFEARRRRAYCSPECSRVPAPGVYRFICPDGRSYVGSRCAYGVSDHNQRLADALDQYPLETERGESGRRVMHEPIACVVCGDMFTPRRSDANTWSGKCRQKLYRETRKAARSSALYGSLTDISPRCTKSNRTKADMPRA